MKTWTFGSGSEGKQQYVIVIYILLVRYVCLIIELNGTMLILIMKLIWAAR